LSATSHWWLRGAEAWPWVQLNEPGWAVGSLT